MDKISLLLSTKDRPEKLKKCLDSIYKTINNVNNVEIIVGVNEKDLPGQKVLQEFFSIGIIQSKIFIFQEPYFLNDKYNYLAHQASNDLIFAIADDLEFKSEAWDKTILEEFEKIPEDKIYLMWINDGYGSDKLPRHYIIHRNWMNVTGNYSANCLAHYYSDNWIYEVSQRIGRGKYLIDVQVLQSSPYLTQDMKDADNLVISEQNMFFAIDNHTYINTQKYRDYEVELLNKFINNYMMRSWNAKLKTNQR